MCIRDSIYKDDDAQKNIEGALAAGVKVGVYFFSTALNEQEAIEEAKYTCSVIRDYDISYPVVYDHEGYDQKAVSYTHLIPLSGYKIAVWHTDFI